MLPAMAIRPSRTAEFVALFRALETVRPPGRRLFQDPYAAALLGPPLRAVVPLARVPVTGRLVYETIDWRWPGSRMWVVVRTRFIDDHVRNALDEGATQVVLLGAGLDTRAHRIEQVRRARFFEVDEPATQRLKRERLARVLEQTPANVRYVALDFERDDLAPALPAAGLRPDSPSVVVWEGVASYLGADAVDATFRSLAALTAPGSTVVFTYLHRDAITGAADIPAARAAMRAVRRVGEPFKFGMDPARVGDYLRERGFELEDERSGAELAREYLAPADEQKPAAGFYRIAVARRLDL